ncbi:MAG: metallophosphoesterase [Spirochaetia bacterium]|jgi:predicted MPP superfamily phosphohydrolase|nr:metallophosphoesterase [Spirochaetia bacterium]
MRGFLIFFIVFISIYLLSNLYIIIRGISVIPKITVLRTAYAVLIVFFAVSFFAGRFLRGYSSDILSNFFIQVGSYWLAAVLYITIALLLIDIIRIANHFIGFIPDLIIANAASVKKVTALLVMHGMFLIIAAGYFNANNVVVKEIPVRIEKKAGAIKNLRALLISDIHLGIMVRRKELQNIVDLANRQNPDIVFLCGDIFDERVEPVKKFNADELLSAFKSRYGTFAVTGNHEYIGNAEEAVKYMRESGITVLRDEAVLIAGAVYAVGREDLSSRTRGGVKRLPLDEIANRLDHNRPIILMDHQPKNLDEAEAAGVDLQLSGHTHGGQIWPVTYIIKSMWELPYGYMKRAATNFYVTSGAGTWGPRMRIGSDAEIVLINIEFGK